MARRPGTLALWVAAATLAGCGEGPRSVLVPDTGWVAESELEAAIETWRGGRPAALTLAFDDNRATHLTIAAPELERRGLRGTFALNSGLVPSDGWEPWVALARRGHELANHGRTHRRLPGLPPSEARDEITRGRDEMQERLPPGQRVVTFVYPYADDDAPAREIARETHLSARTDGGSNPPTPEDLARVAAEGARDLPRLLAELAEPRAWAGWRIHYFHSITEGETPPAGFNDYLDAVVARAESLWVAPQGDVIRYILERDACAVRVRGANPAVVSVTPSCLPEAQEVPLTVRLTVAPGPVRALVVDGVRHSLSERRVVRVDLAPGDSARVTALRSRRLP